jgi:hypothetical protein
MNLTNDIYDVSLLLIDIESETELLELLNRGLLDSCYLESQHVVSFKDLFEFFSKNPVQ